MNEIIALPAEQPPVQWQRAPLAASDYQQLAEAVRFLENPGLAARLSNYIGMPVEKALANLPEDWVKPITRLTREALNRSLDAALLTLSAQSTRRVPKRSHKFLVGLSGAVGGSFGIASLAVELPISATLMLRAIAATAREHGEDLQDPRAKLACLEVFALGGKSRADDAADTGYYAVRAFLSKSLEESAKHLLRKGLAKEGAPALVRFLNAVAQRFSIQVTQKFAMQAIPAVGAVSGATVNLIFIDHFQKTAHAHFTIRRLERIYGRDRIQQTYEGLCSVG
ncbi:EcsC family protein [Methylohalobius crimeensis]|uniref:EcsC family protein n=1 Tax=Methylohalobius crimeensis TaxID=244365 RepID=UPI0003B786D8|nr:EcsC family protein [Methylohalobius crimeensis]